MHSEEIDPVSISFYCLLKKDSIVNYYFIFVILIKKMAANTLTATLHDTK